VRARLAPPPAQRDAARRWAEGQGGGAGRLRVAVDYGDALLLNGPLAAAEALLQLLPPQTPPPPPPHATATNASGTATAASRVAALRVALEAGHRPASAPAAVELLSDLRLLDDDDEGLGGGGSGAAAAAATASDTAAAASAAAAAAAARAAAKAAARVRVRGNFDDPSVAPQTVQTLYGFAEAAATAAALAAQRGGATGAVAAPSVSILQWGVCPDTVADLSQFCAEAGRYANASGGGGGGGSSSSNCSAVYLGTASAGAAGSNACIEADLDVQMVMGALGSWAQPQTQQQPAAAAAAAAAAAPIVVVDGRSPDFLTWALTWHADDPATSPNVASLSHCKNEQKVTLAWATRLNVELAKLALQGRAVFVATGDAGAAGVVAPPPPPRPFQPVLPSTCDGSSVTGGAEGGAVTATTAQFVVGFPASSPYVTAVGSTELAPNSSAAAPLPPARAPFLCTGHSSSNSSSSGGAAAAAAAGNAPCASGADDGGGGASGGVGREQATSLGISGFSSGGGFSRWWARPPWQDAAVQAGFLEGAAASDPTLLPRPGHEGLWNRSGRALPDVAALGGQNLLVTDGDVWPGGGTSAAAPLFAAAWALLDAHARAAPAGAGAGAGAGPLGPAAPLLYAMAASHPQCFFDVDVGDNRCPYGARWKGEAVDCATCDGFGAAKGWDPVSGLGTPNVPCMLQYVDEVVLGLGRA
jgi:hypothetical protein